MRWKAIIPIAIFMGLIAVGIVFFLDPLLKRAMVGGGQLIFGAKVEIVSVRTRFKEASLRIRGVQVADKSEPMKNLFEYEEAVFDMRFLPLLEKKVVIEESSLKGLQFGTPRETSGALPEREKKASRVGKAADFMWSNVEEFSLDQWGDLKKDFDPKKLIDPDNLAAVKAAENAKNRITELPKSVQAELDKLNLEGRRKEIEQKLQTLQQSGGNAVVDAAQKIQAVNNLRKDVNQMKSDIEGAKSNVTAQIQSAQKLIEDVQKARMEDWKGLLAKLKLPSFNNTTIARMLFGPAIIGRLGKGMGMVESARAYMPPKKEEPPPPPRGKGRVVEFPKHNVLPRFLWKKGEISGQWGQENPLLFQGTLEGITSNPPLYGKPAILHLQGSQAPRELAAQATIDHTQEEGKETFQATLSGFPLQGTMLGKSDSFGLGIKNGAGKVSGQLAFAGEGLNGEFQFDGMDLSLEPHVKASSSSDIVNRLQQSLVNSLAKVDRFNVRIGLGGTFSEPTFTVASNLDQVIANAFQDAVGEEIENQKKRLEAELNKLVQSHVDELQTMVNEQKDKALSQITSGNQVVDNLLKQIEQEAAKKASIPGADKALQPLKGLFGR
ncbi:MAG: TIGR03545 family protein [Deltaproteobacteria bacterium]|nr:TIGR03545 family protein [Deltaproteobacteria bacterium]